MIRDEKTYKIIGAAMEVHKELGCGFLEPVYQEALAIELKIQGLPFKEQQLIDIMYKGKRMEKRYQPDFICFDDIIARPPRLSESEN
jgi:GxxExxY protein